MAQSTHWQSTHWKRSAALLNGTTRHRCSALLSGLFVLGSMAPPGGTARAAESAAPPQTFAVHVQATYVEQETDSFPAPYAGANSLTPDEGRETTDATLYVGVRPWSGGEFWIAPEIDQGFGLDDTLGLAGFPSAEAYKVGKDEPYLRLPRAFLRQTWSSSEPGETVDADLLQFAGKRSADRWVLTIGKFSVPDVFDTNAYAHDARNDFLNWGAVDAASFDYAADAWGFTVGAAAERYVGAFTLRAGIFDLSNIPNSEHLEPGGHEFQWIGEIEHRHELEGQPGRLLITGYDSRGRMGLLDSAVELAAQTGGPADVARVRQYRSRLGLSLDLEQQIDAQLGVFARVGKAAGNVEAYEFTDVDRSVSAGLSLKGDGWRRGGDTIGVVGIVNGISAEREQYLNDGGLGILVGDGKLPHPGAEQIVEAYYGAAVLAWAHLTLDYQRVKNPAYNRDRGPVSILALRLHAQF